MSTPPIEHRRWWMAYQVVAAACTLVVSSALVLAVIMLAVTLCKQEPRRESSPADSSEARPLTTEDLIGTTELNCRLTLNSQPAGARVYQMGPDGSLQALGMTPYGETVSCQTTEPCPSASYHGWFLLDALDDGFKVRLQCVIAKEGYESQVLTQTLSDVLQPTVADDSPTQVNYTAVLKPVSGRLTRVGHGLLVNGHVIEVTPDSLDVTNGIYSIAILESDKAE